MARASQPSGKIPDVWNDDADDFDHQQLADNWDAIDAELTRLDNERMPLGTVVMFWRRGNLDPAYPWGTGTVWQPCDGRTILSTNHDFPGGGNLLLPDMRNMMVVGAATPDGGSSPALTYPGDAVPGTQGVGPLNAGGIDNLSGSMAKVAVPSHYHNHNHIHKIGSGSGADDTTQAQTPDGGGQFEVNTDASGSGFNVALAHHTHGLLPEYTSVPRDPTNANKRTKDISGTDPSAANITQTSLQRLSSGGTAEQPTGGSSGDSLTMDARPASRGFVYIMKVRNSPS